VNILNLSGNRRNFRNYLSPWKKCLPYIGP